MTRSRIHRFAALLAVAALSAGVSHGQAPAEIQNVMMDTAGVVHWDAVLGADFYNVYLASRAGAGPPGELTCLEHAEPGTSFAPVADPAPGSAFLYVVTAESQTTGEGLPGSSSLGTVRYLRGACTPLMRAHVLNRSGFGWNEWSRDRLDALGSLTAYIDEQLEPSTISEADNNVMNFRLSAHTPPLDGLSLVARDVILANWARRHLEQRMAMFWINHFNTDYLKVLAHFNTIFTGATLSNRTAAGTQFRDFERFRTLAFTSSFRQMLEAATLSAAMLIYLDLKDSVSGQPNENQPRELLELHSLGVAGGFTQLDVEQLSRIMTGWTVCKKETLNLGDPLAACIADPTSASPIGDWVANFEITRHDCGPKTLFSGTPEEITVPGTPTCSTTSDANAALAEFGQALDAVAAHPSAARFISTKLLQLLVTDTPTQAMVDQLVATWNNPANPNGIGDLKELMRTALHMDAFLDPTTAGTKIKTPFEILTGALRSLRGSTDGLTVIFNYLLEAQYVPYFNEVPTGYAEVGGEWISTGGMLSRQNLGIQLANTPGTLFGSQPIDLLSANGVDLSDGAAVVDFLAAVLMGGRLTQAERQRAINFVTTNDIGQPAPVFLNIRDVTGFLLGYPQFQEQ